MKEEYPKMLYKAGAPKSEAEGYVQNYDRIGYKIVDSSDKVHNARLFGWGGLVEAKEKNQRLENLSKAGVSINKHWYRTAILVAALVGAAFAVLSYYKT